MSVIIILGIVPVIAFGIVMLIHFRNRVILQDLCDLRQNSIDYYRVQLKARTAAELQVSSRLDVVIQDYRNVITRFQVLKRAFLKRKNELLNAKRVSEDLTQELAKVLQQQHLFEAQIHDSTSVSEDMEAIHVEKFELRQQVIRLTNEIRQLRVRNEELEYAINLESISMLEKYQEQGKLFQAIDAVRRSLTRVLYPA